MILCHIKCVRLFLSFLVNHKFGVLSVFFVCAYQKEVHVCSYTKSSATEFAFKLTTEI